MNYKRFFIGFLMLMFSVFLVYPKEYLLFLNWGNDVLNFIYAIVPIYVLTKGFFYLKGIFDDYSFEFNILSGMNEEDFDEFEEYDSLEVFDTSEKGWHTRGIDIWQGSIKDGKLRIDNDQDICHYAKKFIDVEFDSIIIEANISDDGEGDVVVATTNDSDLSDRYDGDKCQKKIRTQISDGTNEIDLDIDWEKYTFIKILLNRDSLEKDSPTIERVLLK